MGKIATLLAFLILSVAAVYAQSENAAELATQNVVAVDKSAHERNRDAAARS